jgi:hypothetical protein
MTQKTSVCSNCAKTFTYDEFHAGFGDQGYLYCDSDETIVTWDSLSPDYIAIVGEVHPWMLDRNGKRSVEAAIVDCPYGGRFAYSALPRCPFCEAELPDLTPDPIYYAVT